jgi:outer membrane receptor for ferrienterochelin and colicins
MLKRNRVLMMLALLPIVVFATGNNLSGSVQDGNSGEPLAYVNIIFEGTDIGTATDQYGNFSMTKIPFEQGELRITMIGYEPVSKFIQFPVEALLKINLERTLIEMSSIVITGTRTERYLKDVPVTTQVLKGLKLRESGPMDVSHILGELTGVSVVENQFGTGIELSGFGADHILVMVDGMELLGRTNGQLDISQIATDQIERIEVVKGASSALYGSEAMGGIINIITRKPQKDFNISASGDVGKYGRYNGNITLTGGLENWRSKFYVNTRRYGGNNLNNNSLWENGSEYNKYNTGLRLENPNIFRGILRLDSKAFFEKQKLNTENIFEDITDNLRLTNRLEYEGNRKNIQYKTGLEYSYFNHLYEQFVISSNYKKASDTTIESFFKSDMTFQIEQSNHLLNGGAGYEYETIASDRIKPNNQNSVLLYGFAQDEWQLNQKLTFLAGFRMDDHSIYGSYFSPKISLMYKPEPISRIRFSYGRGFKAPTFKEMFLDYKVIQVGYYIIGNPELEPEISNSVIFDIERWHTNLYHGRINVFYNEIRNLIDYTSLGNNEQGIHTWQTANIYRAITKGFDIDFTYFFTPKIEFAIGYSYLDTWDVDNESPINLKAKHKGNSKLRLQLPWSVNFNVRAQYVGERYYGEEGLVESETVNSWIDEYFLLHSNLSIPLMKKFEIHIGVNNMTDVYDVVWGPMPGREWYFGLRFNQNSE